VANIARIMALAPRGDVAAEYGARTIQSGNDT
jgi:hypothetical protein